MRINKINSLLIVSSLFLAFCESPKKEVEEQINDSTTVEITEPLVTSERIAENVEIDSLLLETEILEDTVTEVILVPEDKDLSVQLFEIEKDKINFSREQDQLLKVSFNYSAPHIEKNDVWYFNDDNEILFFESTEKRDGNVEGSTFVSYENKNIDSYTSKSKKSEVEEISVWNKSFDQAIKITRMWTEKTERVEYIKPIFPINEFKTKLPKKQDFTYNKNFIFSKKEEVPGEFQDVVVTKITVDSLLFEHIY